MDISENCTENCQVHELQEIMTCGIGKKKRKMTKFNVTSSKGRENPISIVIFSPYQLCVILPLKILNFTS